MKLDEKYQEVIENLWKDTEDNHRIEHNTTPDHENYKKILNNHTDWNGLLKEANENMETIRSSL